MDQQKWPKYPRKEEPKKKSPFQITSITVTRNANSEDSSEEELSNPRRALLMKKKQMHSTYNKEKGEGSRPSSGSLNLEGSRFRIVRILPNSPLVKGRWTCYDYYDNTVKEEFISPSLRHNTGDRLPSANNLDNSGEGNTRYNFFQPLRKEKSSQKEQLNLRRTISTKTPEKTKQTKDPKRKENPQTQNKFDFGLLAERLREMQLREANVTKPQQE